MSVQVQQPAPDFEATAVVGEEFETIRLSQFRDSYVVLLFYPLDFTFVCPTELVAFDAARDAFAEREAHVVAVSVDSQYTHLAWKKTPRSEGGIGDIGYPIVADLSKSISRSYGVLLQEGVSLRGLFLIDRQGMVRHMLINDLPLGRNVEEVIRLLDALRFVEEHGEVCPANWRPGKPTIRPEPAASREFFLAMAS